MHSSTPVRVSGRQLQDPVIQSLLLRLHASTDIPGFWAALRALLTEATPHDALIVYLNFLDFSRTWRAAKILATDNAFRPVSWFEGRRQVDMTPQFVLSQPRRLKLYRLSDVVPDPRVLHRTAFFQGYLAPGGWHHLAVSLFWNGTTVCSQVALRRTRSQGDFSEAEIRLLQDLHPHIETVHNRLISHEEERARRCWLEEFSDHLPFALMFLNLELQPAYVNQEALQHCAMWNFGPERAQAYQPRHVFRVPPEILEACAELKNRWLAGLQASPDARHSLRRIHPRFPGLTANITLQTETRTAAKPAFVIHLSSDADVDQRASGLPVYSMLSALTRAEREVVRLVLAGQRNEAIATALSKSVNTVKSQLTGIYKKLGVTSRAQLLARIH